MPVRSLALVLLGLLAAAWAPGQSKTTQSKTTQSKTAQAKSGKAPDDSNVQNCLHGLSGCDVSALTPDEIKQVSQVSRKRNLDACMEGSTLCDPTRLIAARSEEHTSELQ